jgi:hypothetical protein
VEGPLLGPKPVYGVEARGSKFLGQSWASVAANSTGPTSQTTINLPRTASQKGPQKEASCVRISTAPKGDNATDEEGFTRYLATDVTNKHIQDALRQSETTKDIKVTGVSTTKTGYVIRFNNQETVEKPKADTEWLLKLWNTTKLVKA